MTTNHQATIAAPFASRASMEVLTVAEADAIVGGEEKKGSQWGPVGIGFGLIAEFVTRGKDSFLHKAGTWLGETAAKAWIAVVGL